MNYNKWSNVVGEIICAFDIDPKKTSGTSVPIYDIKDLKEKMPKGCRIAILCISSDIQNTVDLLIDAGIKGIVDFTSEHFLVSKDVKVKQVSVVASIQELVFETNAMKD